MATQLSSEQKAKAEKLLGLLKQYKAQQSRDDSLARNLLPVYTPLSESTATDIGSLMSPASPEASFLQRVTDNPLEALRRGGAGLVRGMTLGLVDPDAPTLQGLPESFRESKERELKQSEEAKSSGEAMVGEVAGTILPWTVAQKGVGAIRLLKNMTQAEGALVPMLGAGLRGGAAGGAVGLVEQFANYAQGKEFDIAEAGKMAAEFAVLDAALMGLGKAGGAIKKLLQDRKFAEAERLYKQSLVERGIVERDVAEAFSPGEINVGGASAGIRGSNKAGDTPIAGTKQSFGRPPSVQGEEIIVESGLALDKAQSTKLPYGFAQLGDEAAVEGGSKAIAGAGKKVPDYIGESTDEWVRSLYPKTAGGGEQGKTISVTLGALGVNPQDLSILGQNFVKGVEAAGGKLTPDVLKQAKNRVKLPESKQLFGEIQQADNVHNRIAGSNMEAMRQLGLYKMSEVESAALADALETASGASPYRSLLNSLHDQARAVGLDIGYVKNYYPRVMKYDVAEQLYDDLAGLLKKLEGSGNVSDQAISKALKKSNESTRDILSHLVKTGQAKNLHEAVNLANREAARHLFPKSSFEKARMLELPSEIYDRDAKRVLTKYANDIGKRIAEAQVWGPNGERAIATLDKIRNVDIDEAKTAEKVLQMWSGQYEQLYGLRGGAKKWADRIMGFEFGSKIGFGTATIPNITQPLISTVPEVGVWRFVRGAGELLSGKKRSMIRASGAINNQALHAAMGYRPGGLMGRFADKTAKWFGFDAINKLNLYTSASAFEVAAKDWHRIAQGAGKRAEWAKQRLADFGIDATKPMSQDKLLEGMFRFSTNSQLQRNVLNDQIILNDPKWRPLFIFKRFGMRQATYIKDMVWREVKRGNVMPILRLAAGGMLGGEFVIWAKNQIKGTLSGEPAYRDEDFASWERVVNNVAAVGTFGMVSDVASVTKVSEIPGALKFSVTPVVLNDLYTILDNVTQFTKDWEKYGDAWLATRRNDGVVFDVIGSLPRYIAKRYDTKQQKRDRLERMKGEKKREIFEEILKGNSDQAGNMLRLWNENNPQDPFTADDFTAKDIIKYVKQKIRTKADVSR